MIDIRLETAGDHAAIGQVLQAAFPTDAEALLVERLRESGRLAIALVADDGGKVVGHIAFSPVTVETRAVTFSGLGLAPVAVVPGRQRQGIGKALIRAGLQACARAGRDFVVVLGEPDYYRQFGFMRAADLGLRNEYAADEEFRVLELRPGGLAGAAGLVRYAPEFALFA
jgi:putative acetyltransferase